MSYIEAQDRARRLFTDLSLTQRSALFTFFLLASLLTGSYLLTSNIVRDGLEDVFQQRLERCRAVLESYSNVHYLTRINEIEAVITSPRFIAAVQTGDSATIANEAPHYKSLLGASVFIVESSNSSIMFGFEGPDEPNGLDRMAMSTISRALTKSNTGIEVFYARSKAELLELFAADIQTADGYRVGRMIVGSPVSSFMSGELKRLTGFDVIIRHEDAIVARTESDVTDALIANPEQLRQMSESMGIFTSQIDGENTLSLGIEDQGLNAEVIFLGMLDRSIAPIRSQISAYLILLAIIGGGLALIVAYMFTSRRIGKQMNALVSATQRIAGGELDFTITPQSRDEFGHLAAVVEQMRSRLARNRDELTAAHKEKVESERLAAIGQSATGIIHDFKGPMAVIRGTLELMRLKHKDDAKFVSQCDNVLSQIDQMTELTRDVIEFSRGKFNLKPQPTQLADYLDHIAEGQLAGFTQKNITLDVVAGDDVTVSIDPPRFRRVLENILNNAREALAPGDKVTIQLNVTAARVQIIIRDTGPGIPAEVMPHIFEPFVTSGKTNGTGLGLSIAKKIINDHGARIEVESQPGAGAAFTITLPDSLIVTPESKPAPIQTAARMETQLS